jgi:translation initiation factor 6 (eIF-6)
VWVLRGQLNAMKNIVYCNCGLATMSGEINMRFTMLLSPLTAHTRKGRLFRKGQSSHLKYHPDPAAWVLPGKMNAMKNLVRCNRGLAIMSVEVSVRFIALLSPFDRTQGPVY